MAQHNTSLGIMAAVLILLGAGCNQPPTATVEHIQTKPAETSSETTSEQHAVVNEETPSENLDLTVAAEALGGGKVKVTWEVGEDTAKDSTAYRILTGTEEYPSWEKKSYWYERSATYREKVLEGIPVGTRHIRVCAVNADQCTAYSNNVMVEVK